MVITHSTEWRRFQLSFCAKKNLANSNQWLQKHIICFYYSVFLLLFLNLKNPPCYKLTSEVVDHGENNHYFFCFPSSTNLLSLLSKGPEATGGLFTAIKQNKWRKPCQRAPRICIHCWVQTGNEGVKWCVKSNHRHLRLLPKKANTHFLAARSCKCCLWQQSRI